MLMLTLVGLASTLLSRTPLEVVEEHRNLLLEVRLLLLRFTVTFADDAGKLVLRAVDVHGRRASLSAAPLWYPTGGGFVI